MVATSHRQAYKWGMTDFLGRGRLVLSATGWPKGVFLLEEPVLSMAHRVPTPNARWRNKKKQRPDSWGPESQPASCKYVISSRFL